MPTAANAAPGPGLTVAKSGPASILAGEPANFTITASNPSSNPDAAPEYNVSFRGILPAGVAYLTGSTTPADAGEPTMLADQPYSP
jgi:large repetitive protein